MATATSSARGSIDDGAAAGGGAGARGGIVAPDTGGAEGRSRGSALLRSAPLLTAPRAGAGTDSGTATAAAPAAAGTASGRETGGRDGVDSAATGGATGTGRATPMKRALRLPVSAAGGCGHGGQYGQRWQGSGRGSGFVSSAGTVPGPRSVRVVSTKPPLDSVGAPTVAGPRTLPRSAARPVRRAAPGEAVLSATAPAPAPSADAGEAGSSTAAAITVPPATADNVTEAVRSARFTDGLPRLIRRRPAPGFAD